ncbi:MAG: DUF5702 domain-containing protein [Clostridiales bacterium]|nr:DUF5702 domain-containing protein [Clostridiales bacterium]
MKQKRKGSISVFLVILFACFLLVTAVLIAAARSASGHSVTDAALRLAGRSVLSEYDKRLFSDYGLLAFQGDEKQIEADITYYAGATLTPKKAPYLFLQNNGGHTVTPWPQMSSVTANLKGFSLLDLNIFQAQIEQASAAAWIEDLRTERRTRNSGDRKDDENRTLRNQSVLDSLPSAGYDSPFFPSIAGVADLPDGGNVALESGAQFLVSQYILAVFSDHQSGSRDRDKHFFHNEVEYVLAGKDSDEGNYSDVLWKLRGIRYALNAEAIAVDSEKMQTLNDISNAAGPYKGVAIAAMLATWAGAETHNDMMRLEGGGKVALLKTKDQWALNDPAEIFGSLGGAIASGVGELVGYEYGETAVAPADSGGWDYEGYLKFLLILLDRETKLVRVMDLIQINLKGTYNEDFLLRGYYTGFRYEWTADGDTYAYTERY